MVQRTVSVCDRCGKSAATFPSQTPKGWLSFRHGGFPGHKIVSKHFCEKCVADLYEWLNETWQKSVR